MTNVDLVENALRSLLFRNVSLQRYGQLYSGPIFIRIFQVGGDTRHGVGDHDLKG